jgi:hypothetical protein
VERVGIKREMETMTLFINLSLAAIFIIIGVFICLLVYERYGIVSIEKYKTD